MGEAGRLVDFDDAADFVAWQPIDDVVMGGTSRSAFRQAAHGIASFCGLVSLDYGGGFASVRTKPQAWATGGAESFMLRCRGDGRQYKFTVRTDDGFDGVQYQSRFQPPRGKWAEVELPVTSFAASFRGRPVAGAGPLDAAMVRCVGLMVSDKQAGPFELLLEWIDAAC